MLLDIYSTKRSIPFHISFRFFSFPSSCSYFTLLIAAAAASDAE